MPEQTPRAARASQACAPQGEARATVSAGNDLPAMR
ncbi:MAG: hypothetical protein V7641_2441 [Blastocatellia bacterium]